MAFKKRTDLNGFMNSRWMQWAIRRTGVAMPNCMTYATARISELLGREEYLDDPRVKGAQELWYQYAEGFQRSEKPAVGALMIWKSGVYGHVAVCEEVISRQNVAWSQSNYGGVMFEYVKGNPKQYLGMEFLGYLLHDKLSAADKQKNDQILRPNDTFRFGVYQVKQLRKRGQQWEVFSELNDDWLPVGPLTRCNANGEKTKKQVLKKNDYFTIEGFARVVKVYPYGKGNGSVSAYLDNGKAYWFYAERLKKV